MQFYGEIGGDGLTREDDGLDKCHVEIEGEVDGET